MHQKHKYRLVYFDGPGRAEPMRLILHFFKVDFEDERVNKEDESWKEEAPMKQVPYLSIDDGKLVLCQSSAIMRYLAKSFRPGFAGRSRSDAARCDMYLEGLWDIFMLIGMIKYSPDEQKEDARNRWHQQRPIKLKVYETHLRENGGKFLVGDTITYADIMFLYILSMIEDEDNEILKQYPILVKYYLKMRDLDELADYIKNNWTPTTLENVD